MKRVILASIAAYGLAGLSLAIGASWLQAFGVLCVSGVVLTFALALMSYLPRTKKPRPAPHQAKEHLHSES